MLTRYASNKSCLALTTAVRAFKDAREGIELVSSASDAATRSKVSLAQVCDECGVRSALVATAVLQSKYKTPLEARTTYANEKPILHQVRVFADVVRIVGLPQGSVQGIARAQDTEMRNRKLTP